ncbi:PREDICTED: uncharacterized protein LOC105558273 [Vollenhovia emeryi]|uniref:uncharacterized protein LOC105558273 n=1 Tax=Vollenhovia emeryi TaxID=411798 RepID=UPI0005F40CA9|nr:PREDICTED: uncharacterized protein LOC105558273 [Vollenhovia emeryi]
MSQFAVENKIGVCYFSEPWKVPTNHPYWFFSADADASATIVFDPDFVGPGCSVFYRSDNIVGVLTKGLYIISVYISPNTSTATFLNFADRLCDAIEMSAGPVIVSGDFNSKSTLWGAAVSNRRGEILARLADQFDLVLLNQGTAPTCVRPQGSSVVDLTWASSACAGRVMNWHVNKSVETLSDHRAILFSFDSSNARTDIGLAPRVYPRWSFAGLDEDLLCSTFEFLSSGISEDDSPGNLAAAVCGYMANACDVAARKSGPRTLRRAVYWWNEEIANLRRVCTVARRKFSRAGRNHSDEERRVLELSYRDA